MKRKILSALKKKGLELLEWYSGRSDMGCQCIDFRVTDGVTEYVWRESYFVGEAGQKEAALKSALNFIDKL